MGSLLKKMPVKNFLKVHRNRDLIFTPLIFLLGISAK